MNITGLNKAAVLAALYNASRPQGMGFLQYDPAPMTQEQAQTILDEGHTRFDYLKGRVMKLNLASDEVDTWGFNRDNGQDAAETAVDVLRKSGDVNASDIQVAHQTGKASAIKDVEEHLDDKTTFVSKGSVAVGTLGLADVKDMLGPAVQKAK